MNEPKKAAPTVGKTMRSSAYPFIPLGMAIQRAKEFWDKERRSAAPIHAAVSHWNYSEKSSGGKQTIAALLQFGLLADEGALADRTVRLTPEAIDILLMPPDDPRRAQLIKKAAKAPKIFAELLSKATDGELPSDQTLTYYLVREKNFNPNTVKDFIKSFRETIRFAGLTKSDNMSSADLANPENPKDDAGREPRIKVGDTVQWTSGGVDQLAMPVRVVSISPDGLYAFLEGSNTGLPVEELTVATAFAQAKPSDQAPPQGSGPLPPPPPPPVIRAVNTKQDVFSLDEGQVVLQWPASMSPESFEDFKAWIDLQVRKIGRGVQ